MSKKKTLKLSFRIPEEDLQEMDALIKKRIGGKDRSDFIRSAVLYWIGLKNFEDDDEVLI